MFLVDAQDGLLPLDKEIAGMLRERGKPFLLAANKVDSKEGSEGLSQFHALSVDRILPVSAEHGTGVDGILEEIVARMPERTAGEAEDAPKRKGSRRSPSSGAPTSGNRPW